MINIPPRKRGWIPRLPKSVTDPFGNLFLDILTHFEEAKPDDIMDYEDKDILIDRLFLEQFHYHSKLPFWGTVLLFLALWYDFSQGLVNIQIYGLALDAFGAVFLALGIVRGRAGLARDTRETAARIGVGGYGGLHQANLRAQIADTIDGVFRASFLLLGFAIQTFALWGS